MASLSKRTNSPYWVAAFDVTLPDGTVRRLKKSTKKRKRSEAMIEAIRMEELENKGGAVSSQMAARSYQILAEAAASAAKGELSEGRARDLLAKMSEASTGEKLKFYTVREWAEDWLKMKAARSKPATMSRYSAHLAAFLQWLGPKADARLESITKTDVRNFRDEIRNGWKFEKSKKGREAMIKPSESDRRTAKTTNHYTSDVSGMFRAAVREGLILASPAAALEKLPEDDSVERDVFTLADVTKLVQVAGDIEWQSLIFGVRNRQPQVAAQRSSDWAGMILIGFYVGARLGDCAHMIWENVDFERGTISFMPEKTARKKKRLEIPMHRSLASYLESKAADAIRTGPIFPSLYNATSKGSQGLSGQFAAIMEHSGIDRKVLRQGQGRQRTQFALSFHSLRHSLTSNLANLDVSEEIRRKIVGHESADVHAKYTHTERETLARALEKLPSL